jgi:hypothetical protein
MKLVMQQIQVIVQKGEIYQLVAWLPQVEVFRSTCRVPLFYLHENQTLDMLMILTKETEGTICVIVQLLVI